MEPNERLQKAHMMYEQLINNYKYWQKGGVGDRISKTRMIDAAIKLAKLDMPNPFPMPKMNNAAVKPDGMHKVTAVKEEDAE